MTLPKLDLEMRNQLAQTISSPINGISGIRHESYSDYELDEQPINFLFENLIRKYAPAPNPVDQNSSDIERDL